MKTQKTGSLETVDYDHLDCDYIKYWKKRQYEHESEKIALQKILPSKGECIVDLGGGYGRLTPLYADRFTSVYIIDKSNKNLSQAQILAETLSLHNVSTKEGDIYNIPLKHEMCDTVLMVRVLHHLYNPLRAFQEIARILKKDGIFILEFSHKYYAKAILRNIFKGNVQYFTHNEPYNQPAAGENGIFLNYPFSEVKHMLLEAGFCIEKKISVSNMRSPLFKRILPIQILLAMEQIGQYVLTPFNFGPSLFLRCRKRT